LKRSPQQQEEEEEEPYQQRDAERCEIIPDLTS